MKATLFGAAVSDGLEDGRVVSGVGGQYNFVAMAHELEGARSFMLLRATRESGARAESNIVFNYGHETIPRHLRDVVVTQYGIADLRGRTDAEVAAALIAIADRRFQSGLAERGLLPMFPLGTDFDADEQRLVPALLWLEKNASGWRNRLALAGALIGARPQPQDAPALARMGLAKPGGIRERLLRRVVALALSNG